MSDLCCPDSSLCAVTFGKAANTVNTRQLLNTNREDSKIPMNLSLKQFGQLIDRRKQQISEIRKKLEQLPYGHSERPKLLETLNYFQESIPELEETYAKRTRISDPGRGSRHPQPGKKGLLQKYRSSIKKVIAFRLSQDPDANDQQLCRWIDAEGAVELPPKWNKKGDRSFATAYKDKTIRRSIESMFSKVRADMRRRGLL